MDMKQILELLAAAYVVANFIVAITPTPKDNEWLAKIADMLSILTSKNANNTIKFPLTKSKK